jgi:tight adherence protein B
VRLAVTAVLAGVAVVLLDGAGGPAGRLGRLLAPSSDRTGPLRRPDWLVAMCVGVGAGLVVGPVAAVAAPVAVLAGRHLHRVRRRRAVSAACAAAVPAVCRTLAAELAAGVPPPEALAAAASGAAPDPLRQLLASAAAADRLGLDVASVLATGPPGCEPMRLVAACWQVCTAAGGGLGSAVSSLAQALQDEQDAQAAVAAELVGPQLSARVMAGLPLVGLGLGAAFGADPLHFLLHTAPGLGCLVLAMVLDGAGLWWVSRLARGALR